MNEDPGETKKAKPAKKPEEPVKKPEEPVRIQQVEKPSNGNSTWLFVLGFLVVVAILLAFVSCCSISSVGTEIDSINTDVDNLQAHDVTTDTRVALLETKTTDLTYTGTTSYFSKNLDVSGNENISGNLTVGGKNIGSTLSTMTTEGGIVSFSNDVLIKNLNVYNEIVALMNGTIKVTDLTVTTIKVLDAAETLTLNVNGTSTLNQLIVSGSTTLAQLNVSGPATINFSDGTQTNAYTNALNTKLTNLGSIFIGTIMTTTLTYNAPSVITIISTLPLPQGNFQISWIVTFYANKSTWLDTFSAGCSTNPTTYSNDGDVVRWSFFGGTFTNPHQLTLSGSTLITITTNNTPVYLLCSAYFLTFEAIIIYPGVCSFKAVSV